MRMMRVVVAMVAGLVMASTSAEAQPRGSYQQSCGNIQFDGVELSAVCADGAGRPRNSRIAVQACRGDIANNDGRLTCSGGGRGGGGGSRGGQDFERDEGSRGPPPRMRDESFDRGGRGGGGRGWDRDEGPPPRMREEGYERGRLPPGSWRGSCRNASVEGSVLYADCVGVGGGVRETSTDLRRCPSFANLNGRLVCE